MRVFLLINGGRKPVPAAKVERFRELLRAGYVTDYGVLMLAVLLASLPTMVLFLVLQRAFAEGITGAIK